MNREESSAQEEALRVLSCWGLQHPLVIQPILAGHINRTFRIETPAGARFALQRLNPIFDPAIHLDIEAITRTLEGAGMATPRLVPAGGKLWIEDEQGRVWRMMTWMDGESVLRADSPQRCREAGSLLGRFQADCIASGRTCQRTLCPFCGWGKNSSLVGCHVIQKDGRIMMKVTFPGSRIDYQKS